MCPAEQETVDKQSSYETGQSKAGDENRRSHCGCRKCRDTHKILDVVPDIPNYSAAPRNNSVVSDRNMGLLKQFPVILAGMLSSAFILGPWLSSRAKFCSFRSSP